MPNLSPMLTGVKDIELLPQLGTIDISNRLNKLFTEARSIRASIAFWALPPELLNQITNYNAYRVLSAYNSFLCVDIQRPTNIDSLADLVSNGVKVFLNIRKLLTYTSKVSTSPGLLHTKMILADMADNNAEFWIGSHNWTVFALMGPNTEASLIVHMNNSAHLYSMTQHFLENIRNKYCRAFDLSKVSYYKRLQQILETGDKPEYVVELEGNGVDNLEGEVICVFGTENDDLNELRLVGRKVHVSLYDSKTEDKYLYSAEIIQSGVLSGANPAAGGISLSERRFAFTEGRRFPFLEMPRIPDSDILKKSFYFANIHILKIISEDYSIYEYVPPSKRKIWTKAGWDPTDELIDKQVLMHFCKGKKGYESFIEVPIDDEQAQNRHSMEPTFQFSEKSLIEKKTARDYRLISKKVLQIN